MPGWLRAATVAASRWNLCLKAGSWEYWSDSTLIATGISRRGWVERYTTPIAPRPSSASIGYRPSCVVLTFCSMGLSVCRTVRGIPPVLGLQAHGAVRPLGEDRQGQVERDPEVRLVHDLADPEVAGEAAEDVCVLPAQPVVGPQPGDGVPHGVACVLHQVRTKGGDGVVARRVAAGLQGRRRGHEVVAPGPQRAALDHSKPE